jgi:hypothetical protein
VKPDIAFVHTSPVHVETFERLAKEAAPGIGTRHVVAAELLAAAQVVGADDAALVERIHATMIESAGAGASVVVCTCSTIGAAAERTPTAGRFRALRIDRAMADRAAQRGPRVLLAAALASTLEPTTALLRESALALGREIAIRRLLVDEAWQHFERGDREAYVRTVASAVRREAGSADVVVLAQASMAPAADGLGDLGIEVLSSPRLGIRAAIEAFRGQ